MAKKRSNRDAAVRALREVLQSMHPQEERRIVEPQIARRFDLIGITIAVNEILGEAWNTTDHVTAAVKLKPDGYYLRLD